MPSLMNLVLDDFDAWCADNAPAPDGARNLKDRMFQLLDGRRRFSGRGDPLRWRGGDVHSLLLDVAVPKLTDLCGLAEHGVDTLAAFLRFLDAADRLGPGCAKLPVLLKEAERARAQFTAAMADPARFTLAKRMMSAAAADGVDLADRSAVDGWFERFNARPPAERADFLGGLARRDPRLITGHFVNEDSTVVAVDPARLDEYKARTQRTAAEAGRAADCVHPAVELPDLATLAAQAADCAFLRELGRLAAWCGEEGRSVVKDGTPSGADGVLSLVAALGADGRAPSNAKTLRAVPFAHRLWHVAVAVDLVRVGRTRAKAGPRALLLARGTAQTAGAAAEHAADLLELWQDVLDAVVDGPEYADTDGRTMHETAALIGVMRPRVTPTVLGLLYDADGPRDFDTDILNAVAADLPVSREAGDQERYVLAVVASTAVRSLLSSLVPLGAVAVAAGPPQRPARVPGPRDGALNDPALLGVQSWLYADVTIEAELTALGRHAVRASLLASGCTAPLAEGAVR